ncbi:T9SS type B sorting domain-containing protein [Arundinibacter roseus]|nr:gliding motility-associated C-terminal domain-containing protein [Arundinibacter roseus]
MLTLKLSFLNPVRGCLFSAIALLFFTTHGLAQQAYVSLDNGNLVLIDVEKCSGQIIGNTGVPMFDIAISPGGELYGNGKDNRLYKINRETAAPSLIGNLYPLPGDDFNSLVFSASGILYAASSKSSFLFSVDTTSAVTSVLGNMRFQAAGDLTFFEGNLYLAAENNNLVRVNITNPEQSVSLGRMNATSTIFGVVTIGALDCSGGKPRMYALGGNSLYEVSATNAGTSRVCSNLNLNGIIYGAASALEANTQQKAKAGRDSTIFLCETSSNFLLNTLLRSHDTGGKWLGPGNSALSADPELVIADYKPGSYEFLYVVGENDCRDTAMIRAQVGTLQPNWPADTVLCASKSWKIALPVNPDVRYRWQDGSQLPTRTIASPGFYSVEISSTCGTVNAGVQVSYEDCGACDLFLPEAFSPNKDGYNDTFEVFTTCAFTTFSMQIFNRWGEVVFETADPAVSWNGMYMESPTNSDLYTYRISYRLAYDPSEVHTRLGRVLLIR